MHYRDGTLAKIGDRCLFETNVLNENGHCRVMRTGLIIDIVPDATICNAMLVIPSLHTMNGTRIALLYTQYITLASCSKAEVPLSNEDDVSETMQAHGLANDADLESLRNPVEARGLSWVTVLSLIARYGPQAVAILKELLTKKPAS